MSCLFPPFVLHCESQRPFETMGLIILLNYCPAVFAERFFEKGGKVCRSSEIRGNVESYRIILEYVAYVISKLTNNESSLFSLL